MFPEPADGVNHVHVCLVEAVEKPHGLYDTAAVRSLVGHGLALPMEGLEFLF